MKLIRPFIIALWAIALSAPAAQAQSSRNIKIIVPYPPGSGPDILSRLMGEQIGHDQGPTVVIENRPGGGTVIGNELVARAAPDGNTVLLVANSFLINPAMGRGNYDPVNGFEPVCYLAATPMVLVVQGSSPYKTVGDLVAAEKAKPGSVAFSSGGPLSSLHIAIEVLKGATGIGNATYVPYAGSGPAINALVGGHVTAVWADYPTIVGHLKQGTLRALVTTSEKRVVTLPDVPTLIETGIAKYRADIFYGIMAPTKTSAEDLGKLIGWFSTALKAPEAQPRLAQQGLFPVGTCGAPFGEFMKRTTDDYIRVVKDRNIKAE